MCLFSFVYSKLYTLLQCIKNMIYQTKDRANSQFPPCFIVQPNCLQTTCMMVDAVLFQLSAFFALFGESSAAACNRGICRISALSHLGTFTVLCLGTLSLKHILKLFFFGQKIKKNTLGDHSTFKSVRMKAPIKLC